MSGELSQFFVEKARIELNEDEDRKSDLLKRFNEWLAKHPYIKNCQSDNFIILMFLRCQKYVLNNAIKRFENFSIFVKYHQKWYDCNEKYLAQICDIIDTGFLTISSKSDANGCRIIWWNIKKFNFDKFDVDDCARAIIYPVLSCLREEETQIAGVIMIFDLRQCSFKFFNKYVAPFTNELATVSTVSPIRIKKIVIYGLPQFYATFMKIIEGILNEKIRGRICLVNSNEDLWEVLDKSLLSEEYGGLLCEADNIEYTKDFVKRNIEIMIKNLTFEIDFEKMKQIKDSSFDSNIGNFRKLDID